MEKRIPVEERVVLEGGFGTGAYMDQIRYNIKKAMEWKDLDTDFQKADSIHCFCSEKQIKSCYVKTKISCSKYSAQ